jgi:hypothetical protein
MLGSVDGYGDNAFLLIHRKKEKKGLLPKGNRIRDGSICSKIK